MTFDDLPIGVTFLFGKPENSANCYGKISADTYAYNGTDIPITEEKGAIPVTLCLTKGVAGESSGPKSL